MLAAFPEVALDGLGSLVAERAGTGSTALAQHKSNVSIKIDVRERQTGHLG